MAVATAPATLTWGSDGRLTERPPALVEVRRQLGVADAGADGHRRRRLVDGAHLAERVGVDQHSVGVAHRREAVPRPDGVHPFAPPGRVGDDLLHLGDGARPGDAGGGERDVAGPVGAGRLVQSRSTDDSLAAGGRRDGHAVAATTTRPAG